MTGTLAAISGPRRTAATICTSTEDYAEILHDPVALRAVLDDTLAARLDAERVTPWEHVHTKPAVVPGTWDHTFTCLARPLAEVAA